MSSPLRPSAIAGIDGKASNLKSRPPAPSPVANILSTVGSSPSQSSWWHQPTKQLYSSFVDTLSTWNLRPLPPFFKDTERHQVDLGQDQISSSTMRDLASEKPTVKDDPPSQKPSPRSLEYSAYLNPAGYLETRYTRMMASLSSIAYRMDRLTPAYLRRMHNIELRHTSLACEIGFKNEVVSAERQMAEDADRLGDGMAGMAPAFTETAFIEEVHEPKRPPELLSSASELATARAYDHFHPSIPRSSSASSVDSDRPAMLEGYTVWSPNRKRRHRHDINSLGASSALEDGNNSTDDSTTADYTRLAENMMGSGDPHQDHQHSVPPGLLSVPTFSSGSIESLPDDGSSPISPRRFHESEPLLVGALADRAQWWDYDASAYSDLESDGLQSDVEDPEPDYFSATEGGRPQNDAFCALDILSRVWPRNRGDASSSSSTATPTSGAMLEESVEGPELKDFAGGMEGDIMQAAAIATASMDASDLEEVGYLEKLRQRVLAVSTVKEVTFAAGAARQPARRAGVPKPDTRDSEGHTCPVHWFVADDPSSKIRFFCLQGSDSLDSWRANLSFDPVPFEDAALGVSVHRGMYEAALALYPRFAPMVAEHLAASPFARISFTGHSLGGSISTILAIMMVHRKLVRPSQLSPLYTFGAAACFCEAEHVEQIACGAPPSRDVTVDTESDSMDSVDMPAHSSSSGLLRSLGIPRDTVRNIILTHDIVPRAFACDYRPVAAMLRQVFTQHLGLQCDDRSIMYHFFGRLLVLQPDDELSWVYEGEGQHPLLPPKAGLYELIEPDMLSRTRQLALSSMDALDSLLASESQRRPAGAAAGANNSSFAAGGTGAGFLPSSWLRRRPVAAHSTTSRRGTTSGSGAADVDSSSEDDDATCNAVEGYPSKCSPPLAATASLGRHAYWQSLSTSLPRRDVSALTLDVEAQLGADFTALLSPFSDRGSDSDAESSDSLSPSGSPSKAAKSSASGTQKMLVNTMPSTRNTLHHAELAMLDTPHPLKVLADPSAYGDHGKISRFHHPDHYTQALGSVVRSNLAPFRRVVGRVDMSRFSTLLRARMHRLQADPMAAWHSAVWDLQAVIAAEGERLDLRPTGPVFGAGLLLESTVLPLTELPNKFQ